MLAIQDLNNFLANKETWFDELPLGGLAPELVGIIKQFAGEAEAPTNFIASNLFASVSALAGRKVRVLDNSYENRLNLFMANIADSGDGKSPARKIVMKPLTEWERKNKDVFDTEKAKWERDKAKKKEDREEDGPKPIRNRLMLDNSDTSLEKFLVVLNENRINRYKNGILLNIDELTDFFPNLNRYSGRDGNPLAKFLLIYNCEDLSVDRLSRDDLYIREPICTIVGGIQPSNLKMVFGGDHGSGFVPRWLFFLENDRPKLVRPNQLYHQSWQDLVELCLDMPSVDLHFSPEAEKELNKNHNIRMQQNRLLKNRAKDLGEYIIKQNYTVRRLAGIIHIANSLVIRQEVSPIITMDEYLYAESCVDYFIKSSSIFLLMLNNKLPLSAPNLTFEETLVQLFKHVPELNVSRLASSLNKDKSNIRRAKRKYIQSLGNEQKINFISWLDGLDEEFPRLIKQAGGIPDEMIIERLLASCQYDIEKLYKLFGCMEKDPDLEKYKPEDVWGELYFQHFCSFT